MPEIPVVNIDSGETAGQELGVPLYVGTTSEYQAGIKAGERLAKEGTLKVACINHEVGNISLDERCQGIREGSPPRPAAPPKSWPCRRTRRTSTRRVEAYLTAHP